jgi:TPR repeat protein
MRFSEGRSFGPGVWVVPVTRLANLKLHTPAGNTGGMLSLALTSLEGTALAEARTTVISAPPSSEATQTTASASAVTDPETVAALPPREAPKQGRAPPAPSLPAGNRADLLLLLDKGHESLRLGNILIARQFYLRAADKGLAEGALALATTYDPRELAGMKGATGVRPDPDMARKWYEKARELGSPEAAARLSGLSR